MAEGMEGGFVTWLDFKNAVERIIRSIQGYNAMSMEIGESQLVAAYNDPEIQLPPGLVQAISILEKQKAAFTTPEAKEGSDRSIREERRKAGTMSKWPKPLVDVLMMPEGSRTQEVLFPIEEEEEEE